VWLKRWPRGECHCGCLTTFRRSRISVFIWIAKPAPLGAGHRAWPPTASVFAGVYLLILSPTLLEKSRWWAGISAGGFNVSYVIAILVSVVVFSDFFYSALPKVAPRLLYAKPTNRDNPVLTPRHRQPALTTKPSNYLITSAFEARAMLRRRSGFMGAGRGFKNRTSMAVADIGQAFIMGPSMVAIWPCRREVASGR